MENELVIAPASESDIPEIRLMARETFYPTYRDILSPEQLDYMYEWMYSAESRPDKQRLHAGRALIEKAFDEAKRLFPDGHGRVELNVNRKNPALSFYRHMGMTIASSGDFDIGNGYFMNDYIMAIDF